MLYRKKNTNTAEYISPEGENIQSALPCAD